MKKNLTRGFTLIELLVVIAIIGILASVVLASLNSARSKGADTAIKANLNNIRAQSELFYDDNNNTYAGGTGAVASVTQCPASATTNSGANYGLMGNSNFFNGVSQAYTQSGGAANCRYINTATLWGVAVQLRTSDGATGSAPDAWCVDSTGKSQAYTYTTGQTIANAIGTSGCN